MDKLKLFIKNKKNIALLIILLLSMILFIPNAKITINMDIKGSAEGNLYYITPFYATFSLKDTFQVTGNENIYTIYSSVKMVKKIKLTFYNISDDFNINIKDIKISLPYIKGYSIDLKDINNKNYTKKDIQSQGSSFIFNKISIIFIIIPVLLFLIIIICIYMLFYNQITKCIKYSIPFIKNNLAIIGIILFLILFEALKIEGMHNSNFATKLQSTIYIFKSDSYFLSLYIMLFYISFKIKNKIITVIPLLIILVVTFIHIIDIAVINLLSARLRFGEAKGFIPDISSIWQMAMSFIMKPAGIYAIILLIYTILFSLYIIFKKHDYIINKHQTIILTLLSIMFLPLFMFNFGSKAYYNTALQDSIVKANMPKSEKVQYSQEKINDVLNNFKFKYNCVDGLNTRKNIIIIFMESVSSYKSMLYSGLDNKTPYMDNLSLSNIYIKDYYSNSYNSTQNRFNLLTGLSLITSPEHDKRYNKSYYNNTIPNDFINKNYDVEYINAADIKFDGTIKLVENSGIKNIYDAYSDIFNNINRRYVFNGVEDKEVYNVLLNRIKNADKTKPFLKIVATMSTHGPYEDPDTHELSYDKTLLYADRQINNFVNQLKEISYFNNGILVITSDHRAMLPITKLEYDKLGPLAHASIPLVIIDGGGRKEITGPFSHTDLGKSLEYLTLDKVCFNQFQHNIFSENKNSCVIYQQLIDLSLIDVKCGKNYGQVLLDGDNTRFIKDELNISDEYKKEIIDYINYLRVVE